MMTGYSLRIRQIIAHSVVVTLLLTLFNPSAYADPLNSPTWLPAFTPSPRIAHIADVYEGSVSTQPPVILIEDLHFNLQVQKNIGRLLTFIQKNNPAMHVGVEGASAPLDYSSLVHYTKPQWKKDLIGFLLKNGEITGSEAYAITTNQPTLLTGIENEKFYRFHLELFRRSYEARESLRQNLLKITAVLEHFQRLLHVNAQTTNLSQQTETALREIKLIDALLGQRVVLAEAQHIAQRLPQTLDLVQTLQPLMSGMVPLERTTTEEAIHSSLDFYGAALLRDQPLAENVLLLANQFKAAPFVVIAGGFHANGMTHVLKDHGIGYVVFQPEFTKQTAEEEQLYVDRLLGRHVDDRAIARGAASSHALGRIGMILEPEGQAVVSRWSNLKGLKRSFLFNLLNAIAPGILGTLGSPLEPSHNAPVWTPDVLSSEANLYAYVRAAVAYRIHEYADEHQRASQSMTDIQSGVEFTSPKTNLLEKSAADKEMSSFPLRERLDPLSDLKVAETNYTFRGEDVPAAMQKATIEKILHGKILHQLLMAGEASRLKKDLLSNGIQVSDEELAAMYFLDIGFLNGKERTLAWGPRQILQLRFAIEKLARENPEFGVSPQEAIANQRLLIHTNEKTDARIAEDLHESHFYGFSSQNIVLIPQHVDHPLELINGKLMPATDVDPVALGHGWASLEAAMDGRGYQVLDGARIPLEGDAMQFFIDQGIEMFHQYRVNDLYNITPFAVDIPFIARELEILESGDSYYLARMVTNPYGTKGGIGIDVVKPGWTGTHLIIADTLSASDWRFKAYLESLQTQAPYHRFANTGHLRRVRAALREKGLGVDFEFKEFKNRDGKSRMLVNPQFVTGMITTIPELKAKTIYKEGEAIFDLKDLKTLPLGAQALEQQGAQSGFNEFVAPYLSPKRHPLNEVNYRPWQVMLSFFVGLLAAPITLPSTLPKAAYVVRQLRREGLHGGALVKGLFRSAPVETFDLQTGALRGLQNQGILGVVPLAHALRSHSAWNVKSEVLAHLLDTVTIPLEFLNYLLTWFFNRPHKINQEALQHSPMAQILGSETLAKLLPKSASAGHEGVLYVLRPGTYAARLQRFFGFDANENAAFAKAYGKLMVAAAA